MIFVDAVSCEDYSIKHRHWQKKDRIALILAIFEIPPVKKKNCFSRPPIYFTECRATSVYTNMESDLALHSATLWLIPEKESHPVVNLPF